MPECFNFNLACRVYHDIISYNLILILKKEVVIGNGIKRIYFQYW